MTTEQTARMEHAPGFLAALDQSGGSTPKALRLYGIGDDAWESDEDMFSIIHGMRERIITSPSFDGLRILGAILFENTMDRTIGGQPTARYLWEVKGIVPFLKVDKGLEAESAGVQLMKPIPGLEPLLARARANGVFGTKMRSVVRLADDEGVASVVSQQFTIAEEILGSGLVPIIEPEIAIDSPHKAAAETLLKDALLAGLDRLGDRGKVMFKLTLPEEPGFYRVLVDHPGVLKVVALSGGYTREEANRRLALNPGVVASFSRALTEGLNASQSAAEFDAMLDSSIASIFQASMT
ncbi:MAG: fructose bisphosphate aldolase [bacterium]|nr:fructose bisphosphate aldolase [bacterium]MDE0417927.1 fructose bisphosphate aldolase [bacterium]